MARLAGLGLVDPGEDPGALADCPFSPWRQRDQLNPGELADLDSRPSSPLDDLWLGGFADLYRALAGIMSPAEADDCELWQLAALLGADRQIQSDDPVDRIAARLESEKSSLGERAARLPNAKPQVETVEEPVDMTQEVMRSMGITLK